MADLVTIKVKKDSVRLLKVIAALKGEKQYEVVERIVQQEHKKVIESSVQNLSIKN